MAMRDVAKYVVRPRKDSGNYYYYRRVPTEVLHLETRTHISQSLKTDDLKEALTRGEVIHAAAERLWSSLSAGDKGAIPFEHYAAAVKIAQSFGFTYRRVEDVAELDLSELDQRFAIAQNAFGKSEAVVNAMVGTAPEPNPRFSDMWRLYEENNDDGLTGMSPGQLDKHTVSRKRAIKYAMDELGDLELAKVTRSDVLRFRDWWNKKVKREGLTAYSANRSFSDIKGMLTVIDNALHTEFHKVWEGARLKETNANKLQTRPPSPLIGFATRC